jgi:hypothetical protein
MKSFVTLFVLFVFGSFANAAQINSGKYNSATQKVELNVSYGGGCSEHFFKLELVGGCRESYPVQCDLQLDHTTDEPDLCEAYITEDIQLDIPEEMLNDQYYQNAIITIRGGGDTVLGFQLLN